MNAVLAVLHWYIVATLRECINPVGFGMMHECSTDELRARAACMPLVDAVMHYGTLKGLTTL